MIILSNCWARIQECPSEIRCQMSVHNFCSTKNSKISERILMKFSGKVRHGPRKNIKWFWEHFRFYKICRLSVNQAAKIKFLTLFIFGKIGNVRWRRYALSDRIQNHLIFFLWPFLNFPENFIKIRSEIIELMIIGGDIRSLISTQN